MAGNDLWLIRHGESVGNTAATRAELDGSEVIELDIRDADVPLSDTGVDQAEALATWMDAHRDIDRIWVSPYLRARQTLALALGDADGRPAPVVDERLRDRELGILDLLTWRGVINRHPGEAERRRHLGKFYHRPPGGESWADVALRLRSFLRDVTQQPDEKSVVVAHDAVVMLFLYLLLPLEEASLLEFAASHTVLNASVTHLHRESDRWELVAFSAVDHLQREGADVTAHPGRSDVQPD